jgi:hypothetical protein
LIGKEHYTREFLDQRDKDPAYNYENIAAALDLIIKNAIAMREKLTIAHYIDNYEDRLMST